MQTYKVTMTDRSGKVVGQVARQAVSPQQAMEAAESDYPAYAAYTAEPLAPFDYSCIGGMFGK